MAQQLSRSPALGAPQRRTCPPCAFQKSKLLPSCAAPHKTTPTVPSSPPAQAARPLSRPMRSASDESPTSQSPSPFWAFWSETGRHLLWSFGIEIIGIALIAIFGRLLPMTPDNRHLHFAVVIVLLIRCTRESATSYTSSSSLSRPLRSASVFDNQPTSPPSSPWAKALHSLRRFKAGDPPRSWAEILTFLLWDFSTGLLGVAILAYILPWHPSPTAGTFTIYHPALILLVFRKITPRL